MEFRPMRRSKQALDEADCIALLQQQPRGVLAVHGEGGYPYALPMDHLYLDGKLYFHCAKEGHKLDAIAADDKVSFCVMDEGYREEGDWPLHIRSVIVFGRLTKLSMDEASTAGLLRKLGMKYYPDAASVEEEIRQAQARVQMLVLTPEHITGKLVKES